jgi:hypothetical protein
VVWWFCVGFEVNFWLIPMGLGGRGLRWAIFGRDKTRQYCWW